MIAKFIRGDGVEFECTVGSPSFELMAKDGAFTRVEETADQSAEVSDAESEGRGDAETADEKTKVSGKNAKTQSRKK